MIGTLSYHNQNEVFTSPPALFSHSQDGTGVVAYRGMTLVLFCGISLETTNMT